MLAKSIKEEERHVFLTTKIKKIVKIWEQPRKRGFAQKSFTLKLIFLPIEISMLNEGVNEEDTTIMICSGKT